MSKPTEEKAPTETPTSTGAVFEDISKAAGVGVGGSNFPVAFRFFVFEACDRGFANR